VPAGEVAGNDDARSLTSQGFRPLAGYIFGRGNARGGRLPNSVLLPHTVLFAESGAFLPRRALADAFARAGLDPARPVVAICQRGARAAAAYIALRQAGYTRAALYDGAMAEWLADPTLPVETGGG
jgi:thiosulfate/3-mercaptopyruvate sulfurtransferase